MSTKSGLQYENKLVRDIYENSDFDTKAYRIGYSGNSSIPSPDFIVFEKGREFAFEVKKSNIGSDEYLYIPLEDLQQLYRCHGKYTSVYLAVKFSRREMMIATSLNLEDGFDEWFEDMVENFIPDVFEPKVTDRSLRLTKPSVDDWHSAREGYDDWERILNYTNTITTQRN